MGLGIVIGLVVGGIVAIVLKQADAKDPGPLGTVKRQLIEATEAGKEEAAEKEAELLAEYEAAKQDKPKTP